MSSLTTLPALLAFLEQTRFVFSTCPGTPSAVTITGESIDFEAYSNCQTITSVVIPSIVTAIGMYTIITIPTIYFLMKISTNIIKITKIKILENQIILFFCFYNNCNILFYFH